jgi:hypothetical protein
VVHKLEEPDHDVGGRPAHDGHGLLSRVLLLHVSAQEKKAHHPAVRIDDATRRRTTSDARDGGRTTPRPGEEARRGVDGDARLY